MLTLSNDGNRASRSSRSLTFYAKRIRDADVVRSSLHLTSTFTKSAYTLPNNKKGDRDCDRLIRKNKNLDWLDVLSLQTFRSLGHVELHGLTFLQALETACLNR